MLVPVASDRKYCVLLTRGLWHWHCGTGTGTVALGLRCVVAQIMYAEIADFDCVVNFKLRLQVSQYLTAPSLQTPAQS
jgi:hypothetical protein